MSLTEQTLRIVRDRSMTIEQRRDAVHALIDKDRKERERRAAVRREKLEHLDKLSDMTK